MGALGELFGSKPNVPVWQNINLADQQRKAINDNINALPSIESLASKTDKFNQDQLTSMLNEIIPGWSGMTATASSNISKELSGEIPTDVMQQIQSSDAARALTGGFGGSGMLGNLTARDLGLTSLSLTQAGQGELENWTSMIDRLFAPGQFNVSSMFVDPQQEFQDTMANQEMAWGQSWLREQVNAMPKPQAVGVSGWLSSLGGGMFKGAGDTGGGDGGGGIGSMGGILKMLF